MSATAEKTDPALWDKVKREVTEANKGGAAGEWSARKAQMAVQKYKQAGGGYAGAKSADNHLAAWTDEDWDTKSGATSGETGERYLPKEARDGLTDDEYRRTSDKKRRDTRRGKQHSPQPADVADKTAAARHHGDSKADLYRRAQAKSIPGRSTMSKAQLAAALAS